MENELLKAQLGILSGDLQKVQNYSNQEFQKIAKAFMQMGNLTDLLYLEVAVLLEMLVKKGVLDEKEYGQALEETAKKIQADRETEAPQEASKDEGPIIKTP